MSTKRQHTSSSLCNMFDCKVCGNMYKAKKSLYRHERENHSNVVVPSTVPSTEFICKICKTCYQKRIDLLSHIKQHKRKNRQSRLLCAVEMCSERFMTYVSLQNHLSEAHSLVFTRETFEFTEKKGMKT